MERELLKYLVYEPWLFIVSVDGTESTANCNRGHDAISISFPGWVTGTSLNGTMIWHSIHPHENPVRPASFPALANSLTIANSTASCDDTMAHPIPGMPQSRRGPDKCITSLAPFIPS